MALGNILDIVLAIRIKENQFWWEPPLLFSDKFIGGGGSLHIQVTLLDRVTALCEARPLEASRHPSQPGPPTGDSPQAT